MLKKLISLVLVALMVFSSFSVGLVNAAAADDTMTILQTLIKKFPNGKYWNHASGSKNNPDGVTSSPCSSHYNCNYFGGCSCNSFGNAIQCMGYAAKIAYEITGVDRNSFDERYSLDVSKLRVGDIIRANGHSVCVTGVKGNAISITDCNYGENCIIRWRTINANDIRGLEYVLHLKSNDRTNEDTKWHDAFNGTTSPDIPETPVTPENPETPSNPSIPDNENTLIGDGEIWQMGNSSLNIRKEKNTDSPKTGSIPANAKFDVYEKSYDDKYLWAKVTYNGVTGYSALNYASYISGELEKPELEALSGKYTTKTGVTLKWSAVSGADKYTVSLYKDNKLISTYTSTQNTYKLTSLEEGKYSVKITSSNSFAESWKISGKTKNFTIEKETVAVTGVSLRKTGSIEAGNSGTFTAVVSPSDATNKALTWTSSNPNIATVNDEGKVTGIAPGKVTITCTSKENKKLSASCEFIVKPAAVKVIQTKANTTESTVSLAWSESKGATGYEVYRYNTQTRKYTLLARGTGKTYTDKKLSAGTTYTYAILPYTVVDGVRINAPYTEIKASTTPTAIKVIKQTGSDTGRARIQWEKKEGAYAYVVFKYNTETKKFVKLGATTATSIIDKDKPATKVYYRVVTVVKTGDGYAMSKPSATLTAITGLESPENIKTQSNASAVKLTWSKVDYATHYQIFRVVDGKKVLLKTVTSGTTSYTDKNLKSGVTYTYYVRAARQHSSSLNLYSSDTAVKAKTTK